MKKKFFASLLVASLLLVFAFGCTTPKEPEEEKYAITLSTDETKGEVVGNGDYVEGQQATVYAVPKEDYLFEGWYRGDLLVSQSSAYSFEVSNKGESLSARYKEKPASIDDYSSQDIVNLMYQMSAKSYTLTMDYKLDFAGLDEADVTSQPMEYTMTMKFDNTNPMAPKGYMNMDLGIYSTETYIYTVDGKTYDAVKVDMGGLGDLLEDSEDMSGFEDLFSATWVVVEGGVDDFQVMPVLDDISLTKVESGVYEFDMQDMDELSSILDMLGSDYSDYLEDLPEFKYTIYTDGTYITKIETSFSMTIPAGSISDTPTEEEPVVDEEPIYVNVNFEMSCEYTDIGTTSVAVPLEVVNAIEDYISEN